MTETDQAQQAPLIRVGDQGPAVGDVQRRLARLAVAELPADEVFGERTRDAVREFQRRRGLPADGIVGPETWRALVEASYTLGDRLLWHSATLMRGDDVLELQQRLNQLGFNSGREDGILGPLTRAALEELQRNVGLPVDGVAGPSTVEILKRLHRDHQSPGVGVRAREREALRNMAGRGFPGSSLLIDPAYGPHDASIVGHRPDEITWAIASRLSRRLAASGADVSLSRGPSTTPSGSERALLANELGVDVVVSISVNAHETAEASGCAAYYFGGGRFVSEVGRRLAELVHDTVVGAGWLPDCRIHPMTWAVLRETRMPALVLQPGFVTSATDRAKLTSPDEQDRLANAVAQALTAFFAGAHALSST